MATSQQGAIQAYLIDPDTRTVEAVDMTGGAQHLEDIRKLLKCRLITTAPMGERDTVYCDDEGLIRGPVYQFFGISGYPQPIAGRGLVVGLDADGYDTSPSLGLDEVRERVFFIERLFRDMWGVRQATRLRRCEIAPLARVEEVLTGDACHG